MLHLREYLCRYDVGIIEFIELVIRMCVSNFAGFCGKSYLDD